MVASFLSLFFPNLCHACTHVLYSGEEFLCTRCHYHLPRTQFHRESDNILEMKFWGRVPFNKAAAFYYFHRGEKVQRLLHEIKYKGNQDLCFFLGQSYGYELSTTIDFNTIDLIVPVPLHKDKLKKRGFNQSQVFANGLAAGLKKPCLPLLQRIKFSETQTRKSREERWVNVKDIFALTQPDRVTEWSGKNILLVDDVVTTGATLEACANVLTKIPEVRLNMVALAYASTS